MKLAPRALVVANVPLDSATGSGAVIKGYIEALIEGGYSCDIITCRYRGHGARLLNMLSILFVCLRVRASSYNVAIFWGLESVGGQYIFFRAKNSGCVVLHQSNGPEARYIETDAAPNATKRFISRVYRALSNTCLRSADAIGVVSEYDKQWLQNAGFATPCHVFSPGIDPHFRFQGKISKLERPAFRILFCGTWLRKKGIDVVVEGVSRFLAQVPQAEFIVVGPPPDADLGFGSALKSQVIQLGTIPSKQRLAEVFRHASVLICPSRFESFGLVIAEAMAAGTPVIATPTGIAASLTNGLNAILIDGSPDALLAALVDLYNAPSKETDLIEEGLKFVSPYRWPALKRLYIDTLKLLQSAKLAKQLADRAA
jgi:glycosyltransferase involved in cell wall biosynthesis